MITQNGKVGSDRKDVKAHGTCRLSIEINGVVYAVRRIRVEGVGGWRLRKADGMAYRVVKDRWGVVRCDCPDQVLGGRAAGECKHCRALAAAGLVRPSFRAANRHPEAFDAAV
jgi:hypothetical protein